MPFSFQQRVLLLVVPRVAAWPIRVLGRTLRYDDVLAPGVLRGDLITPPVVFAFWHRSLLCCAHRFRGKGIAILVSRSFDGELIARTVEQLGFVALRGSSSRGGAVALRQMADAYRRGLRCAFTADGPRGPAMTAKAGPAQLAVLVDAEWIGVFYAMPDRAWVLKSWDRFLIPKPFAKVKLTWPAHAVPDQQAVQAALDEAVRMAGPHSHRLSPVLVSDFDFNLPEELIAQSPPAVRGSSRMLQVERSSGLLKDDMFSNLPASLRRGDLLVLNDSRVLPARLYGTRLGQDGRIEVLLIRQDSLTDWRVLVRPGRKVRVGTELVFADSAGERVLDATVVDAGEFGQRTLRFNAGQDFLSRLDRVGHMPLPPYIHRTDSLDDRSRYQTVYAAAAGSAAAPTAGLHFTPEMLQRLQAAGVEICYVTLHVGLGTFQPVRAEKVQDIQLHAEQYTLPEATAAAVRNALAEGRRVLAAGTTTTRTLEHCAAAGKMEGHSGSTNIFISPGYRFQVISGLLTNFHLPQSTLLMLVSAFLGSREAALAAYAHAVMERYRFYSYGDCMLIL